MGLRYIQYSFGVLRSHLFGLLGSAPAASLNCKILVFSNNTIQCRIFSSVQRKKPYLSTGILPNVLPPPQKKKNNPEKNKHTCLLQQKVNLKSKPTHETDCFETQWGIVISQPGTNKVIAWFISHFHESEVILELLWWWGCNDNQLCSTESAILNSS